MGIQSNKWTDVTEEVQGYNDKVDVYLRQRTEYRPTEHVLNKTFEAYNESKEVEDF